jgi:AraC-like DNA-binding protein
MSENIGFLLLIVGLFNGALIVILLATRKQMPADKIMLCLFIFLLFVRALLYILGKETIYDPHSWLYVPPVDISLTYGPFIYLFILYTVKRSFVKNDLLHFIPGLVQVAYYIIILSLDKGDSTIWLSHYHFPFIIATETTAVVVSMAIYLYLSIVSYLRYQNWLNQHQSDAENYRMNWIKAFLFSIASFFVIWTTFSVAQLFFTANYSASFGLFIAQSLLLSFLAFESWRNADMCLPKMSVIKNNDEEKELALKTFAAQRGAHWIQELEQNEWYKDPKLSLKGLAAKLGTNSTSLSLAINASADQNFNTVVNQLRVNYVCQQIMNQQDQNLSMMSLATEAGFNSKNSFNRNFKQFIGLSPTQYARKHLV